MYTNNTFSSPSFYLVWYRRVIAVSSPYRHTHPQNQPWAVINLTRADVCDDMRMYRKPCRSITTSGGEMTLSAVTIRRQISVTWIIHNMGWNALPKRGGRGALTCFGKTFCWQYNNIGVGRKNSFNLQNVPNRLHFCFILSYFDPTCLYEFRLHDNINGHFVS